MSKVHLPVIPVGSIKADGSRADVQPADVRGRFVVARKIAFVLLIGIWAALPWLKIRGNPAIFLDVDHRRFYLFGATFNAQDIWLLFFLLTGVAFSLVYVTAVLGRVWCGWACPQTVFLEAFYRPIERLIEGPRERRLKRNAAGWGLEKIVVKLAKHAAFFVVSAIVAHMFLAYFVTLPGLFRMVRGNPSEHPEAFAWAMGVTLVFWGNFGWFREQLCVIVCPYGRFQSIFVDPHTIVVGYDEKRGEPRGKASDAGVGDCVDCKRCIVVCPTGIDIRNGLQLDCIACTACIDACDDVMDRLERPRGLIRYDSLEGLAGRAHKWVRTRTVIYTALLLLGAAVFAFASSRRVEFEANLLRLNGAPYVVEGATVRNAFEIHLVNKGGQRETFRIEPTEVAGLSFVVPLQTVTLDAMGSARAPIFVTSPTATAPQLARIDVRVRREGGDPAGRVVSATWLAPGH